MTQLADIFNAKISGDNVELVVGGKVSLIESPSCEAASLLVGFSLYFSRNEDLFRSVIKTEVLEGAAIRSVKEVVSKILHDPSVYTRSGTMPNVYPFDGDKCASLFYLSPFDIIMLTLLIHATGGDKVPERAMARELSYRCVRNHPDRTKIEIHPFFKQ